MPLIFGVGAAIVLAGVAAGALFARSVGRGKARRLTEIGDFARSLAEGDLTAELRPDAWAAKDLAELEAGFDALAVQLRSLVEEVRLVGGQLESTSAEVLERAEQEISAASEQASSLVAATASTEQLRATTSSIAQQAKTVAEMATTVQSSVGDGKGAMDAARQSMEAIRSGSEDAARKAEELSEASRTIVEVVGMINEIARRTKILAVNAAIEAARAEGLGAGFNVVAAEVRLLADSVVDSTKQIEATMGEFDSAIKGIVDMTEQQERRVEDGAARIADADAVMLEVGALAREAANAAQEIAFGAQQQQAGTEQVAARVQDVADAAERAATSRGSNQAAARTLQDLTQRLTAIARRFRP